MMSSSAASLSPANRASFGFVLSPETNFKIVLDSTSCTYSGKVRE